MKNKPKLRKCKKTNATDRRPGGETMPNGKRIIAKCVEQLKWTKTKKSEASDFNT